MMSWYRAMSAEQRAFNESVLRKQEIHERAHKALRIHIEQLYDLLLELNARVDHWESL